MPLLHACDVGLRVYAVPTQNERGEQNPTMSRGGYLNEIRKHNSCQRCLSKSSIRCVKVDIHFSLHSFQGGQIQPPFCRSTSHCVQRHFTHSESTCALQRRVNSYTSNSKEFPCGLCINSISFIVKTKWP